MAAPLKSFIAFLESTSRENPVYTGVIHEILECVLAFDFMERVKNGRVEMLYNTAINFVSVLHESKSL